MSLENAEVYSLGSAANLRAYMFVAFKVLLSLLCVCSVFSLSLSLMHFLVETLSKDHCLFFPIQFGNHLGTLYCYFGFRTCCPGCNEVLNTAECTSNISRLITCKYVVEIGLNKYVL